MITAFNQMIAPKTMAAYQKELLITQLDYAKSRSRFYGKRLFGVRASDITDLSRLPFTTAADIKNHGHELVCVGGEHVKRIVTLKSSGSSGAPKRLYFTAADLERTSAFFREGMKYMCTAGDVVLICMPGVTENGIVQLLAAGLRALGANPHCYGLISDYADAVSVCREIKPHTIVGLPAQLRKLALLAPDIAPANVLLSADYVPGAVKETLSRIWGCEVFTHYGLTESGYGCAVECPFHMGQHIRHDELLIEIAGPDGTVRPYGEWGEIVVTTLRREAMPLIRYRTGDIGRIITGVCGCGSELPRLDHVRGRVMELEHKINIYMLDELLLTVDGILDYSAAFHDDTLTVTIDAAGADTAAIAARLIKPEFPEFSITVIPAGGADICQHVKRSISRH